PGCCAQWLPARAHCANWYWRCRCAVAEDPGSLRRRHSLSLGLVTAVFAAHPLGRGAAALVVSQGHLDRRFPGGAYRLAGRRRTVTVCVDTVPAQTAMA